MITNSKFFCLALILILLQACSSAYKPTPDVLELKQSMTKAEAILVVRESLSTIPLKYGLCGGQGLPSGETFNKAWKPNIQNPDIFVTEKGFSINAYRDIQSTSLSGNISAPIATTTYSQGSAFRQSVEFSDIEYIRMFHDVGMEYGVCYVREGQSAAMMGLQSFGNFYGTTMEKLKLDRFIAAMMILAPQAELQTGS